MVILKVRDHVRTSKYKNILKKGTLLTGLKSIHYKSNEVWRCQKNLLIKDINWNMIAETFLEQNLQKNPALEKKRNKVYSK